MPAEFLPRVYITIAQTWMIVTHTPCCFFLRSQLPSAFYLQWLWMPITFVAWAEAWSDHPDPMVVWWGLREALKPLTLFLKIPGANTYPCGISQIWKGGSIREGLKSSMWVVSGKKGEEKQLIGIVFLESKLKVMFTRLARIDACIKCWKLQSSAIWSIKNSTGCVVVVNICW